MTVSGKDPLSPFSMGSTTLDELTGFIEDYKRGELSMSDCERLYKAWQYRNRDQKPSIKEKKVFYHTN